MQKLWHSENVFWCQAAPPTFQKPAKNGWRRARRRVDACVSDVRKNWWRIARRRGDLDHWPFYRFGIPLARFPKVSVLAERGMKTKPLWELRGSRTERISWEGHEKQQSHVFWYRAKVSRLYERGFNNLSFGCKETWLSGVRVEQKWVNCMRGVWKMGVWVRHTHTHTLHNACFSAWPREGPAQRRRRAKNGQMPRRREKYALGVIQNKTKHDHVNALRFSTNCLWWPSQQ